MNETAPFPIENSSVNNSNENEFSHSRVKSWIFQLHYLISRSSRDYRLHSDWLKKEFTVLPEGDAVSGKHMIAREFTFFGERHIFGRESVWNPPKAGVMWMMRMHGFEWISDIRAYNDSPITASQLREYIADWIMQSGKSPAIARHPTVIGQRVSMWLLHANFILSGASDRFRRHFIRSLARQSMMLSAALQRLAGRASFPAILGLICASKALPYGECFESLALNRLVLAINSQIRPDGGHVTRSPSLQLEQLEYLCAINTVLGKHSMDHDLLYRAIHSMRDTLKFMTYPDGKLALFNDSIEDRADRIQNVLHSASDHLHKKQYVESTGFVRLNAGALMLMVDTAIPNSHSAHNHFGTLGFELCDGMHRLFVNCGAYRGADANWRRACKTTAAHTALCVGDESAYPQETISTLTFLHEPRTTINPSESEHFLELDLGYNGYESRFGLVHQRTLRMYKSGKRLEGRDQLSQIHTDGVDMDFPVAIRFHLHPAVKVSKVHEHKITLSSPSGNHWIFSCNAEMPAQVEESIYAGVGGKPQKSSQILIQSRANNKMNMHLEWLLEHSA